jgi:hypothetical protein
MLQQNHLCTSPLTQRPGSNHCSTMSIRNARCQSRHHDLPGSNLKLLFKGSQACTQQCCVIALHHSHHYDDNHHQAQMSASAEKAPLNKMTRADTSTCQGVGGVEPTTACPSSFPKLRGNPRLCTQVHSNGNAATLCSHSLLTHTSQTSLTHACHVLWRMQHSHRQQLGKHIHRTKITRAITGHQHKSCKSTEYLITAHRCTRKEQDNRSAKGSSP